MTVIGIVLGGIAALALSRVLESQLHDVSTADPLTLGATMLLLLLVAMAASLIPAGRAAGIDPIRVLRDE